jgi:chromosome segregation ATPase
MVTIQAQRIAELEEAYTSLKFEKENVTTSYRNLSEKYKRLEEKAEPKKAEATEVRVSQLEDQLAKETHDYTDYRWDV